MGFFRNLIRRADEFDRLDRECSRLESDLSRERSRIALLEKELKAERASKDKILLRTGDAILAIAKVRGAGSYVADAEPPRDVPVLDTEPKDMELIRFVANAMRDADKAAGIDEVDSLDAYIEVVRKDPSAYILN